MEPSLLTRQIEREAARIAAAFGVGEWKLDSPFLGRFRGCVGDVLFTWRINSDEQEFCYMGIEHLLKTPVTQLFFTEGKWLVASIGEVFDELMARGLYRLGFTDQSVLSQLPSLSFHEKLELRLSLPREFWPPSWEEEASRPAGE